MKGLDYLGMFALGGFVGALVTFGLRFITGFPTFAKALTMILGAALSGTVLLFIERLDSGRALGAYCVGLLIALMWAYARLAITHIKSTDRGLKVLGWAHIVGVVLATLVALALVLPPAFREMWSAK